MGLAIATIAAVTILATAITSMSLDLTRAQGQIITQLQPIEILPSNTLNFSIHFENKSNATLLMEPITEEQGNVIVAAINAILQNDNEVLEELELEEPGELELEEEEEESDNDDNSNGGNGNNNGNNNNNNNDNDDNDTNDLLEPPGLDIPEPEEGDGGDGGESGLNSTPEPEPEDSIIPGPPEEEESKEGLELNLSTTSKGCAEGLGYYADDPNPRREPIDSIGEGPPEGQAFCLDLGCPYSPPDLSK